MSVRIINADTARQLLIYEPETGVFTWRESRGRVAAGDVAGGLARNGYWEIYVGGRRYRAHRLAWLITHGEWPEPTVDHINGVKTDNRIANLRQATVTQNHANQSLRRNSQSGIRGVHYSARDGRWVAKITANGRTSFLGQFKTKDEAAAAYATASRIAFGDFARVRR
jgi:hypothetical protein